MRTNPNLDNLERDIQKLKLEFDRYFNGAIDLPPFEQVERLKTQIRTQRNTVKTSIDKFRLTGLEAKFNSFNEMFSRRVRNIEEGRTQRPRKGDAQPRMDVQDGVMVSGRIDEASAAAIYQGLYSGTAKAAKIDLGKFRGYLDQQAKTIRQKTGCQQVQFRVSNEGGQLKLKAKPIKRSS